MKRNPDSSGTGAKRAVAPFSLERILSGGQTGADRAALDLAIERGIPHGGWCPQGRLAEDGTIGPRYSLQETPSSDYAQRTEWNVRDSDGTVVFSIGPMLSGGSKTTEELALQLGKPFLHVSKERDGDRAADRLRDFIETHEIRVLNVAGPRSSNEPEVGSFVRGLLDQILQPGQ